LYYLTYILLCTAPLSHGWGVIANPDDMIWWYEFLSDCCCFHRPVWHWHCRNDVIL